MCYHNPNKKSVINLMYQEFDEPELNNLQCLLHRYVYAQNNTFNCLTCLPWILDRCQSLISVPSAETMQPCWADRSTSGYNGNVTLYLVGWGKHRNGRADITKGLSQLRVMLLEVRQLQVLQVSQSQVESTLVVDSAEVGVL